MPNEYSNFTAPDTGSASGGFQNPQDANAQGYVWDPVAKQYVRPGGTQVAGNASTTGSGPPGVNGLLPSRVYDPEAEKDRYRDMAGPIYGTGPTINQSVTNQSRGLALDSLEMLRKRAEGGATPAQILARQQTQGAVAGIQSGAASIKGGAGARAAAARGAAATGARVGAQGAQDLEALRAREMADASNQYFGASSAQRDRDIGIATDQAKLDAGQRVANEQRSENYESLGFGTQKENVDHVLGRTAEEANATNAARNAGLQENEASRQLVKDVGGTIVSGGSGAAAAYANTRQPEKSDNPWDPSNYSGSDPRMKKGISPIDSRHEGAKKHATKVDYDPKYLGSPFPTAPDMVSGAAPVERSIGANLHDAMAKSVEGAHPYAAPEPDAPKGESLFGGRMGETAPKGYAAMRAGHEGAMFGASPEAKYSDRLWGEGHAEPPRQWAPGTGDFYAGKEGREARDRDIALSDPRAKEAAWDEGAAAATKNAATFARMSPEELKRISEDESHPHAKTAMAVREARRAAFDEGHAEGKRTAGLAPLPRYEVGKQQPLPSPEPQTDSEAASAAANEKAAADLEKFHREYEAKHANDAPFRAGSPIERPAAWGPAPAAPAPAPEQGGIGSYFGSIAGRARAMISDPRTKDDAHSTPMASANRSMAPSRYEYKPEFLPPEQHQGEVNVGPMADKMEANPVAKTAIVEDPNTGLLAIDKTKGLKLVMGGLADLQRQVDRMKGARA